MLIIYTSKWYWCVLYLNTKRPATHAIIHELGEIEIGACIYRCMH